MFRKLFGGGSKQNEPDIVDVMLSEIRKRLLPLGFVEKVHHGHTVVYDFLREDMKVSWGGNIVDGYGMSIFQGMETMHDSDDTTFQVSTGPPVVELSESMKAVNNDFKNRVISALDDWLKTVQPAH